MQAADARRSAPSRTTETDRGPRSVVKSSWKYLYSVEGQLLWLKGYCHPIRFNDMVERGVIPQDLLDALPPAENYAKAVFPSLAEQEEAKAAVAANWASEMGVQ
jgi:putative spermidine/putrescine transport system substrate-binding protein